MEILEKILSSPTQEVPLYAECTKEMLSLVESNEVQRSLDEDKLLSSKSIGEGVTLLYHQGQKYAMKECTDGLVEALAGLLVVNTFREDIPNFVLTHAYKRINEDKDVIITEYIDGVSIDTFFFEQSEQEFDLVMLCVIYALDYAHKKGFTHYDPKCDNILVRDNEEEIEISYGEKKVRTRYVPVFIDFGLSSFLYQGKRYGITSSDTFIDPGHNPMADFQRLLFTLDLSIRKKVPLFCSLTKLYVRMSGCVPLKIIHKSYGILPVACYQMKEEEVIAELEKLFVNE